MFKLLIKTILLFVLLTAAGIYFVTYTLYKKNFNTNNEKTYIYIHTGSGYNELLKQLENKNLLINKTTFSISANIMGLKNNIKAGRYLIDKETTNKTLINNLKNGKQALVKLALDNIRTKAQLAKTLSENLEIDYNKALNALSDDNIAKNYNFTNDQFMCMFIADTYYLNWNTSIKRFLDIMYQQNKKIWNTERLNKAASINKTPTEVYILASIVHLESPRDKELPTIAGLYINRLKKNMRLASDPTVIFAHNDFTIKRVRFKHLNIKSPYNTYKHRGLPPGPISTAPVKVIDAVLNYDRHNYLYMSAKDDLSGYHNFSSNFDGHKKNAKSIRKQFNKLKL